MAVRMTVRCPKCNAFAKREGNRTGVPGYPGGKSVPAASCKKHGLFPLHPRKGSGWSPVLRSWGPVAQT
jgi:hypothetical protein